MISVEHNICIVRALRKILKLILEVKQLCELPRKPKKTTFKYLEKYFSVYLGSLIGRESFDQHVQ